MIGVHFRHHLQRNFHRRIIKYSISMETSLDFYLLLLPRTSPLWPSPWPVPRTLPGSPVCLDFNFILIITTLCYRLWDRERGEYLLSPSGSTYRESSTHSLEEEHTQRIRQSGIETSFDKSEAPNWSVVGLLP